MVFFTEIVELVVEVRADANIGEHSVELIGEFIATGILQNKDVVVLGDHIHTGAIVSQVSR